MHARKLEQASSVNVVFTGGSGTLGHALVREALKHDSFHRIAIYSRDEHKHFHMQREFSDTRLRFLLGDVRDYDRLRFALKGVDAVLHCAALKHVPSGEYAPFEHVKTNVLGSQNMVMAAIDAGVPKVLAISTDKAVDPTTLYGATKLCMERLMIAANSLGRTKFSLCRYGNVLGSRGSFLELLRKLQAEGAKSFPLRSKESTRFWISAEDAARFVLARLGDMQGEEIFVPILPSSTALEFARKFLPDAEPEIVGVPPGEKIHETLISEAESQYVTTRGNYYVIRPRGQRNEAILPWRYVSNSQPVPA